MGLQWLRVVTSPDGSCGHRPGFVYTQGNNGIVLLAPVLAKIPRPFSAIGEESGFGGRPRRGWVARRACQRCLPCSLHTESRQRQDGELIEWRLHPGQQAH